MPLDPNQPQVQSQAQEHKRSEVIDRILDRGVGVGGQRFIAVGGFALLMTLTWVASNWLKFAATNYGTLVTGLVGVFAAYVGSNVAQTHLVARSVVQGQVGGFVRPGDE